MKEMVYATGSQIDADGKDKEKKAPKMISLMALVTAAISTMEMLGSTDLAQTAKKVCDSVKSPVITAIIIGAFAYWTVGDDQ